MKPSPLAKLLVVSGTFAAGAAGVYGAWVLAHRISTGSRVTLRRALPGRNPGTTGVVTSTYEVQRAGKWVRVATVTWDDGDDHVPTPDVSDLLKIS